MVSTTTKKPSSMAHPYDPLTPEEMRLAVAAVRKYVAKGDHTGGKITPLFNTALVKEPPKYDVLRWSGLFSEKELLASAPPGYKPAPIRRQADINLICNETKQGFDVIVDLPSNLEGEADVKEAAVVSWTLLEGDIHPSLQTEELLWIEEICRTDPKIKEVCDAVGIDQKLLYVDGWCVAVDERFPGRRLQQGFCFTRLRPDDNLYAHPCDFVPVIDSHTGEILAIDFPGPNPSEAVPVPASSAAAHAKAAPRGRFAPPATPANYLPEQIQMDEPNFKVRDTLKPLHVIQPEGVSYSLAGRVMRWERWTFHIGFTYREGLVLSNITYDDPEQGTRPVFHRLSVAEMVVPYAKTVFPHHRKHAFDTGEYGVGALANSLALGCDCLGSITYLDADFITRNGGIQTIKSAICIHEEDAGILFKHTDYRDNRAHVARNRKLVISSICTVANYDYGFYFNFSLDGSIELEVKATGIVNAYPLAPGETVDHGREVQVAPQIVAHHHQHLFSYRIDPMIDGLNNRVVQVDTVPDEADVGSETNYYGNGFHTVKTQFNTSKESQQMYEAAKARTWLIQNPNVINPVSEQPVGFKIVSKDMPPMLAKPGSMVWNRAPFARKNMFVTTFRDDEIFPSEVHINQNPGGKDFGLQKWVDRDDDIVNKDIVAWPCFGVTHVSRPEEWPIMPVEVLKVALKPVSYYTRNPGLDVPSTADKKSRNADEAFVGGKPVSNGANGAANGNGTCCAA